MQHANTEGELCLRIEGHLCYGIPVGKAQATRAVAAHLTPTFSAGFLEALRGAVFPRQGWLSS